MALPSLHNNQAADFLYLKQFIETRYPGYWVCYINEDETLLNPMASRQPVSVILKGQREQSLRVWLIRESP